VNVKLYRRAWISVGLATLLTAPLAAGCSQSGGTTNSKPSAPAHSAEWQSGYKYGTEMYQQSCNSLSPCAPKNPQDSQLVEYCDQSEIGAQGLPSDGLADMSQWTAGCQAGCYSG
jgi:hypothetical protein